MENSRTKFENPNRASNVSINKLIMEGALKKDFEYFPTHFYSHERKLEYSDGTRIFFCFSFES